VTTTDCELDPLLMLARAAPSMESTMSSPVSFPITTQAPSGVTTTDCELDPLFRLARAV
jgi:hypothetical protein